MPVCYVREVYSIFINELRMQVEKAKKNPLLLPVLLMGAVVMVFGMLRLGVWQLDRAAEKQALLDQVQQRAASPAQTPDQLLRSINPENWSDRLRFQAIKVRGRYLADRSVLIDNQVVNSKGGYQVITPMQIDGVKPLIMVSRGWLAAGATRQELPVFDTPNDWVEVEGRLNLPPAQPPLWKEGFAVNEGAVWQYLPIAEYAAQIGAQVLPLMVELAPENAGTAGLTVHWQAIDDQWVAKHKGYAFQWFAMAIAFFIACMVLVYRKAQDKFQS